MTQRTVLVINSGSSSIKYQLVDPDSGASLASGLVERIGVPVHIVQGEYSNIKVTTPEDMVVAEAILRNDMGAGELMKTAVHEAKRLLGGVVRRRKEDSV